MSHASRASFFLGLLLVACSPAVDDTNASLEKLDGHYVVSAFAEGNGGEAYRLTVRLAPDETIWPASRRCPKWSDVEVEANGRALARLDAGGLEMMAARYTCRHGLYSMTVEAADFEGDTNLSIRVSDEDRTDDIVFRNFIVPPRIAVTEPADATVAPGDEMTIEVLPSVRALGDTITLQQGPDGVGVTWATGARGDFEVDDTHLRFVVPATAHVGADEALQFHTGTGWLAVPVDCAAVTRCEGLRATCPSEGCGTYGMHTEDLDDAHVTAAVTVESPP